MGQSDGYGNASTGNLDGYNPMLALACGPEAAFMEVVLRRVLVADEIVRQSS